MGNEDDDDTDDVADDCVSHPCGATAQLVDESRDPYPVAPEEDQVLHLAYDSPEEMRQWPRRVRGKRNRDRQPGEHEVELFLYYPNNPTRQVLFTRDMFQSWIDAHGETRDATSVATWGPKTTVEFTVSKIDSGRLVWSADATDTRITLDIYNLDPSQPKWRRLLDRSLAILPISHLQAANLKSVFLDFHVGTSHIGPHAPVVDGGTNWRLSIRPGRPAQPATRRRRARAAEPPVRRATEGIDVEGCSAVCATFAALNRVWGERDVPDNHLPSEDGIDTAFDRRDAILFTPYHEIGHLLDYGGFTRTAALVSGRLSAHDRRNLWGRYRDAIDYVGESNGAGEGFAEAYRQRMIGDRFRASNSRLDATTTARTILEMNQAFDSLGMPSVQSVGQAWQLIRAHYAVGG